MTYSEAFRIMQSERLALLDEDIKELPGQANVKSEVGGQKSEVRNYLLSLSFVLYRLSSVICYLFSHLFCSQTIGKKPGLQKV